MIEHQLLVKPSSSYSDVDRPLQQDAVLPTGISITAIGNVVRKVLNMSYKKLTHSKTEKYSLDNIQYCQLFLNTMRNVPAVSIKFFDEAGNQHQCVCNPHHGHGPMGEKTVVIIPRDRGSSHTLLFLCCLEGIDYAKIIEGAAHMITYLQFWGEASRFTSLTRKPVYSRGEHVIVDNCPTHSK